MQMSKGAQACFPEDIVLTTVREDALDRGEKDGRGSGALCPQSDFTGV